MFYDTYIRLCEEHNEQPYALAVQLGAKKNSIVAQWAKGSIPRAQMLNAIADHFGVTVGYLLTGESDKKSQPQKATGNPKLDRINELFPLLDEQRQTDFLFQLEAVARSLEDRDIPKESDSV